MPHPLRARGLFVFWSTEGGYCSFTSAAIPPPVPAFMTTRHPIAGKNSASPLGRLCRGVTRRTAPDGRKARPAREDQQRPAMIRRTHGPPHRPTTGSRPAAPQPAPPTAAAPADQSRPARMDSAPARPRPPDMISRSPAACDPVPPSRCPSCPAGSARPDQLPPYRIRISPAAPKPTAATGTGSADRPTDGRKPENRPRIRPKAGRKKRMPFKRPERPFLARLDRFDP